MRQIKPKGHVMGLSLNPDFKTHMLVSRVPKHFRNKKKKNKKNRTWPKFVDHRTLASTIYQTVMSNVPADKSPLIRVFLGTRTT